MHLVHVLLGRWPASRQHDLKIELSSELTECCHVLSNVNTSSTHSAHAMLDAFGDGEFIQACRKVGRPTFFAWHCSDSAPERPDVDRLCALFDECVCCHSSSDVARAIETACERPTAHLICALVAADDHVSLLPSRPDVEPTVNVASVIAQTLAARGAIARLNQLFAPARGRAHFVATAYHAAKFRHNVWDPCVDSFAVCCKELKLSDTEFLTPESLLRRCLCAVRVLDDNADEIRISNSVCENDDHVRSCSWRVSLPNGATYELECAAAVSPLPMTEFAQCVIDETVSADVVWRVKDPKGVQENLLENAQWDQGEDRVALDQQCRAAMRQLVARRSARLLRKTAHEPNMHVVVDGSDTVSMCGSEDADELRTTVTADEPEDEPQWLHFATMQVAAGSSEPTLEITLPDEFVAWQQRVRECIRSKFGTDSMQRVTARIDTLTPHEAYTLFIGDSESLLVYGCLHPRTFQGVRACRGANDNQDMHHVFADGNVVNINQHTIDILSYTQCGSMAIYAMRVVGETLPTAEKPPPKTTASTATTKGLARRLETKKHQARLLAGY